MALLLREPPTDMTSSSSSIPSFFFAFTSSDPSSFENDVPCIIQTYMFFTFIWIILLLAPPGPKATNSTYRLHFIHGLLSSFLAILYIWGKVPDYYPTMASTSYFVTDLCNMLCNDFYHKITSYQQGNNRLLEYIHHSLCGSVLIALQFDHFSPKICTFPENPGPSMILAELSTPFLIAWRAHPNVYMALLFFIAFVAVRLIYQCAIYIPYLMSTCNIYVSILCCAPYAILQLVFTYKIVVKMIRGMNKMRNGEDAIKEPSVLSPRGKRKDNQD